MTRPLCSLTLALALLGVAATAHAGPRTSTIDRGWFPRSLTVSETRVKVGDTFTATVTIAASDDSRVFAFPGGIEVSEIISPTVGLTGVFINEPGLSPPHIPAPPPSVALAVGGAAWSDSFTLTCAEPGLWRIQVDFNLTYAYRDTTTTVPGGLVTEEDHKRMSTRYVSTLVRCVPDDSTPIGRAIEDLGEEMAERFEEDRPFFDLTGQLATVLEADAAYLDILLALGFEEIINECGPFDAISEMLHRVGVISGLVAAYGHCHPEDLDIMAKALVIMEGGCTTGEVEDADYQWLLDFVEGGGFHQLDFSCLATPSFPLAPFVPKEGAEDGFDSKLEGKP